MLNTPVLFLIFNRPAFTEQVFAHIQRAQPKQLFIAADGPRNDKPGEKELCEAARKVVMENIHWACEVKTFFRDKNAGCSIATFEAMNWFFDHVEQGIMIEDDTVPASSFFRFCEELLERYKNDERIMAITGVNYFFEHHTNLSYSFSMHGASWGMATWRRAWKKFDYSISGWGRQKVKKRIRRFMNDDDLFKYYSNYFNWHLKDKANGVWDYRWFFCRLANEGLSIVPAFNQIRNIGFGPDATHTKDTNSKLSKLETGDLGFPLHINNNITADRAYDGRIFEEIIKPTLGPKVSLARRILRRLKHILKSILKNSFTAIGLIRGEKNKI
jgi:hypothetical protein